MKLKTIGVGVVVTSLAVGCGKFNLNKITYKVTPNPLEYHGDSIAVTVTAEYPAKTMPKKSTAEVTPVLKYKGGEKSFKTVYLKGEKATEDGETIKHGGGSFKYKSVIPYADGMDQAELHVKAVGKKKGTVKAEGETTEPIALGTIVTPLLVQKDEQFAQGKHNYGAIYKTQKVNFYFPYNSFNIRPSEKKSEEMKALMSFVDAMMLDSATFEKVDVNGWASPDGEEGLNNELSEKRSLEVKKFMETYFKGKKLAGLNFSNKGNGADKAGFNNLVGKVNLDKKGELTSKINSGARNSELKSLGTASYNQIEKEILSPLRRSEVSVTVKERQKTTDELKKMALNTPDKLTLEELLYTAQELLTDDAQKVQVFTAASRQYPEDWRANNNIGVIYAKQGKLNEALTEFQKAEKINGSEKTVKGNIGAIYMKKGDRTQALNYYKQAVGSGTENNHNLGSLYILQGKYSDAVSTFGSECSFNAALAKVLAGSPEKAGSTIDCSTEKDKAISFYLKAVAAARTSSNQAVFDNLKQAIQKDASLKAKAKTDLEFLKLRDNSEFKSIVN